MAKRREFCALFLVTLLSGCAALGASGPSAHGIKAAASVDPAVVTKIQIVELNEIAARRAIEAMRSGTLAAVLGDGTPFGAEIGKGDVLDITIWEAPPAVLYGSGLVSSRINASHSTAVGSSLPEQMVDINGQITIPFAGHFKVAGKTPYQIESEIIGRLTGLAHQPQVIVRVVRNAVSNVTVVGDVANSARVPLSPKGERLLDVIASAGGVRQPVGKTTIRVSRGNSVASLPLEKIIADPLQNIRMQADDVVTALFQPYSFTSLGATGNNAELPFEATGISLAQALGRIGGLRDDRADARGVFIFRLEDPSALDPAVAQGARLTPDGKIPVIYRVDLKNPSTFFVAQGFPIRDRDVLYVSNAPAADLQKFVNIVAQMAFSIVGVANSLK